MPQWMLMPVYAHAVNLDDLLRCLKETHFPSLMAYFKRNRCFGQEEELAYECICRVFLSFRNKPCNSLEHATGVLWRNVRRVLIDHKRQKMRGHERVSIDRIDQGCLTTSDNPYEEVVGDELWVLLSRDNDFVTDPANNEALLLRYLAGARWDELCHLLDESEPTARRRLAMALAFLVVRLANHGVKDTLLEKLKKENQGHLAVRVLRRLEQRMAIKEIAHALELSEADIVRLKAQCVKFFITYLRNARKTKRRSGKKR